MIILGISAYFHDSAAAITIDGKVIAASPEERFSRKKHDKAFPINAIKYCLEESNVSISDIDSIVFYEKPFLRFERILETIINNAPFSFRQYLTAMPIWLKERLNMKSTIRKNIKPLGIFTGNIYFTEHHFSHAAMSYYSSSYTDAAVLIVDAVGEWSTTSIYKGVGNQLILIKRQEFPNSIGLLYSAFTYFLGFKVNSDEYKVMGLAPYGDKKAQETINLIQCIKENLLTIHKDGAIELNMKYFSFAKNLKMINIDNWERLLGVSHRNPTDKIQQSHCNIAYAIQEVTEEILFKLAIYARSICQSDNLCLGGGVALNCVANGKLRRSSGFKNVFVPHSPGDDGGAIGATLAVYYQNNMNDRIINTSPYLGPSFKNSDIKNAILKSNLNYEYLEEETLYTFVAKQISIGKIVGWFQNRMEFGPRALGSRSIIADPRIPNMKRRINASIKFREEFRPFAPVVLIEDCDRYFTEPYSSPYMMFTTQVRDSIRERVPNDLCFNEAIGYTTSSIAAVTHIDFSSRVQTISSTDHKEFYRLLSAYKEITGESVVLNTSFNIMGEPIVCTPTDAINTFLKSGIDILVMNNFIIFK